MKKPALCFAAALLLASPQARADEDTIARPERRESAEKPPARIRTPLILGGLGFTAGFWAVNAGSSYMFPDEPGYSYMRRPVIGPWQALAHNDCNGGCSFINYFNVLYFTFSGLAQAGGLGLAIEALVTPTSPNGATPVRPAAPPTGPAEPSPSSPGPGPAPTPAPASPSKPLFYLPTPSPIGQGGYGVSFGGIF